MDGIAKKSVPINVIFHYPSTKQGRDELKRRVSAVYADIVSQYIKDLGCPSSQKAELLEAVIASVKQKEKNASK